MLAVFPRSESLLRTRGRYLIRFCSCCRLCFYRTDVIVVLVLLPVEQMVGVDTGKLRPARYRYGDRPRAGADAMVHSAVPGGVSKVLCAAKYDHTFFCVNVAPTNAFQFAPHSWHTTIELR